jgi:hypothetical protein
MSKGQPASLSDLLDQVDGYKQEDYLSPDEMSWIRQNFAGVQGMRNVNTLRKIFLPTVGDIELPVEKLTDDVWMLDVDFKNTPVEQIKPIVMGRQEAVKFIMNALVKLKVFGATGAKTKEQVEADRAKNSTK